MSNESAATRVAPELQTAQQPVSGGMPHAAANQPEFSLRAVLVGILVAVVIGLLYPFVVLKIGFGPNISVVSAFLGFILIALVSKIGGLRFLLAIVASAIAGYVGDRLGAPPKLELAAIMAPLLVVAAIARWRKSDGNRYEYNIVQTAGTASGQQGFMVIVLAAFDLLASRGVGPVVSLTSFQIFVWLTLAGVLGCLLAVPLRKHYIDEENLTFADGVAAGETLLVLDSDYKSARRGVIALTSGAIAAAFTTLFSQFPKWRLIPEDWFFGKWGEKLHVGTSWSLLSIASGMLVGMRVTLSMGLGMVVAWFVAPPLLHSHGWITDESFRDNLRWIMWPALGLMLTGGLTSLALKWKVIAASFRDVKVGAGGSDFPMRWVVLGSIVSAIALIAFQWVSLGFNPLMSALAIGISVPLMIVGTRVLGETNWAPISTFANLVQMFFGAVAPGSLNANMIASGMSGTVAANGEQLMQDYKAGKLIGSNNKYLTYMQLLALPIGAAAVAYSYPLLRAQNGIGPDRYGIAPEYAGQIAQGLSAPASVRWAGVAEAMSKGISALPPHALTYFLIACALGIVLTLLEPKSHWVPSVTSVGLGMLIEARYVMPMVIGGVLQYVWGRLNPRQEAEINTPLSSGVIVGEAMMVLVMTALTAAGVFEGVVAGESVLSSLPWGIFLGVVTIALLIAARRSRKPGDEVPLKTASGGH